MARRTNDQIFLDRLTYMAGDPPVKVSSKALKDALAWADDRYDKTRRQLIDAGVIKGVVGGVGGSLELMGGTKELVDESPETSLTKPVNAFISYSHADSKIKTELLNHMAPLKRLGLINDWHDQEIKPGNEWESTIISKLARSELVILLISSDFIASDYCYTNELKRALERHAAKKATVIPVILRHCLWTELPFGKLQALPTDAKPVTSWENQDEALMKVAQGVREAAQAMRR
ncbi:toll/interleukin-1 receptor domain-containing protein [Azospirillum sp. TSH100]|uniref:toll/interleukin-1 receptor domain-containing protein n=1 Tax=Azospirillum sp. TSH100 TaxID=652764 RepID=UPI0010AAC87D|nr:toll/interleukin-1 receptor domain-containing protein [Azospirillum sp. TSH100]QCG92001.1 toll/interleukin-1 receptor domain-containing protein [Azospirillum sp. TSH100]